MLACGAASRPDIDALQPGLLAGCVWVFQAELGEEQLGDVGLVGTIENGRDACTRGLVQDVGVCTGDGDLIDGLLQLGEHRLQEGLALGLDVVVCILCQLLHFFVEAQQFLFGSFLECWCREAIGPLAHIQVLLVFGLYIVILDLDFGYDGELYKVQDDKIKPIQDKVYDAVEKVAADRKLDIILDKAANAGILYSNAAFDRTDDVIIKLGLKK